MPYVASLADVVTDLGNVLGTGQCLALVQKVSGAPLTHLWNKGSKVKGDVTLAQGTAIATFGSSGTYENKLDGSSHAAIYISQSVVGIDVYDQWTGQPVHKRTIRFRNGQGSAVNDGDQFYVVA